MKTYLPILAAFVIALKLHADGTNSPAPLKIGAGEAAKYYDKEMIVTGNVAEVSIRSKVVLVNLDKAYPNSPFTIVVFAKATNEFGNINALYGKNVEAKGIIKNFKDKPEIVLDSSNQLTILNFTNSPSSPKQ